MPQDYHETPAPPGSNILGITRLPRLSSMLP
jgi:hypothetical protein